VGGVQVGGTHGEEGARAGGGVAAGGAGGRAAAFKGGLGGFGWKRGRQVVSSGRETLGRSKV